MTRYRQTVIHLKEKTKILQSNSSLIKNKTESTPSPKSEDATVYISVQ